MRSLAPDDFPRLIQAIRENSAEVAEAFLRGTDLTVRIEEGGLQVAEAREKPSLEGSGLEIRLSDDPSGAGIVIWATLPSETRPGWLQAPDATGESRLATLAQELAVLLLPDDCATEKQAVRFHAELASAASLIGLHETTRILEIPVEIALHGANSTTTWYLIAPVTLLSAEDEAGKDAGHSGATRPPEQTAKKPASKSGAAAISPEPVPAPGASSSPEAVKSQLPPSGRADEVKPRPRSVRDLPIITRSLLRIRVPVQVTLAETRRPVSEVLQFAPGVIIQFSKPCDEPLELQVNGRTIAVGEAVKVGDKFGLRITKMTPPAERYVRLVPPSKAKTQPIRPV